MRRFRMSFDDFMRNFKKLEICNLGPDVMEEVQQMTGVRLTTTPWSTNTHDGVWQRGTTAGGCRNYIGKQSQCSEQPTPDELLFRLVW